MIRIPTITWARGKPLTLAFLAAALVAACLMLTAKPAHAANFTVGSMGDVGDNSPGDGTCASIFHQVGTDPECTLRAAIEEANANGETDTISFYPGLSGTITLTLGQLVIDNDNASGDDLSINGPGASKITVSGNDADRVFSINQSANATISGLTISDGSADFGGGINNGGGTLTLTNSTVSANQAHSGGGIYNLNGTLTLKTSTVSGNAATDGGGILSFTNQKTTVTNSTISGNTADRFGGGIFNHSGLTFIEHSTITNNTAPSGQGSGVFSWGMTSNPTSTEVLATIISANPGTDVDLVGSNTRSYSKGYNLIGDGNATSAFNQPGDQSAVANPGLGSLANNGGPTFTHALLPGSPALGAIPVGTSRCATATEAITTDQRGISRPQGQRCDIGAFELLNAAPVARANAYIVREDAILRVPRLRGVLANDTDANGDRLTARKVTTTKRGTLILRADGSLVYNSKKNFNGVDTFYYRAFDGKAPSNNAKVTIRVRAVAG